MSDSFKSIGDLLPGALSEATSRSQSRAASNVVSLMTQEQKFIQRVIEMDEGDAREANSLGFTSRIQVQASLPYRNPGNDRQVWTRRNGNMSLTITPFRYEDSEGKLINVGFPYGTIPRLIMTYLSTQAIKTKSPEIDLGDSMAGFMHEIGMISNGKHGKRLKDQSNRLFSANINYRYEEEGGQSGPIGGAHRPVADQFTFWWDEKHPQQRMLFSSYVKLNPYFYEEIMKHPVPIDMRAVLALKSSPLALDLYQWLTHRVSYLKAPARIPWVGLEKHLGAQFADRDNFKKACNKQLKRIKLLWPDLNLDSVRGGILLKPSRPHVSRTLVQVLRAE